MSPPPFELLHASRIADGAYADATAHQLEFGKRRPVLLPKMRHDADRHTETRHARPPQAAAPR